MLTLSGKSKSTPARSQIGVLPPKGNQMVPSKSITLSRPDARTRLRQSRGRSAASGSDPSSSESRTLGREACRHQKRATKMPQSESSWSAFTSIEEARRRAGGRSHYNSLRGFNADLRRVEVGKLVTEYGVGRGIRARIARELNVHPSTVTRDVQKLWGFGVHACPTCEHRMTAKQWEQLEEDRTRRPGYVLAAAPRGRRSREPTSLMALETAYIAAHAFDIPSVLQH